MFYDVFSQPEEPKSILTLSIVDGLSQLCRYVYTYIHIICLILSLCSIIIDFCLFFISETIDVSI